jgi:4'-phosphopantetheinyl transferase
MYSNRQNNGTGCRQNILFLLQNKMRFLGYIGKLGNMATPWGLLPKHYQLPAREIHFWLATLDPPPGENNYRELLPPLEIARADRFIFKKHRHRFARGRGILRQILGRYLNQRPQDLDFEYNARGKPFLKMPGQPALVFNVSHSEDRALFGFQWGGRLGVDIEKIELKRDFQGIAQRFFSWGEQKLLTKSPPGEQGRVFFKIWVLKEAFIKGIGEGLGFPLQDFQVGWNESKEAQLFKLPSDSPEQGQWNLKLLEVPGPFTAACAFSPAFQNFRFFHWEDS